MKDTVTISYLTDKSSSPVTFQQIKGQQLTIMASSGILYVKEGIIVHFAGPADKFVAFLTK